MGPTQVIHDQVIALRGGQNAKARHASNRLEAETATSRELVERQRKLQLRVFQHFTFG